MAVRFASYNVENLFARPRAFDQTELGQDAPILDAFREFNSLIAKVLYTSQDKARMIELLLVLEVYHRSDTGIVRRSQATEPQWARLRANRGSFDVDRRETGIEIVAEGRGSWIGWVELVTEPVDEIATRMTAKVIAHLNADVLAVIEAENRPSLDRFNRDLLASRYGHCMLIDGNDMRGIDVGIMTTTQIEIVAMRSNVDVPDPDAATEHLFSRDCPEYQLKLLPNGEVVWVLVNHFKSQSGGGGNKRRNQSAGVIAIVNRLLAANQRNVIVLGDLNEGPSAVGGVATNLAPLFVAGGPLVDAYSLPAFDVGPRPGTFQSSGIRNRLDYILVSQDLAPKVVNGGIERHGLWGNPENVNPPTQWEIFPEITGPEHGASDHAAIFVDIEI